MVVVPRSDTRLPGWYDHGRWSYHGTYDHVVLWYFEVITCFIFLPQNRDKTDHGTMVNKS